MLDLILSEELILPIPLERAREACERALLELDWVVRESSPTTLLAREKAFLLWSKTLTRPVDLCVLLSAADDGARVQFTATLEGGKTMALVFRPIIQGRLDKLRELLFAEAPGPHAAATPRVAQPPHAPRREQPPHRPPAPAAAPPPLPRAAGRIFISYRRKDSADVAGRIYDRLVDHFGEGTVFQDVEDIPLGMDFSEHISGVVSKCDAFLAIIGDEWLKVADDEGRRRLDNPADNVRIEIESALQRKIPLIPVLVCGASMPREDELPESLRKLAYRNATQVRPNPDFRADMTRLIEGLEDLFSRRT
jgi:hypothetical protein